MQFLWPRAGNLASLPLFQFGLLLNFLATLPLITLKNTTIHLICISMNFFFKFSAHLGPVKGNNFFNEKKNVYLTVQSYIYGRKWVLEVLILM